MTEIPPRRLPAIIGAVLAVAVMGAVVAFALANRDTPDSDGGGGVVPPHETTGGALAPRPGARADMSGCTSVDPDRPPEVKFELKDNLYDFGTVKQNEKITAEVTFVNAGSGLLCVTNVGTGCGCLKVEFKNPAKKRFNPGERGTVVMVLDTTAREGVIDKSVEVFSNDLNKPVRGFRVRCDVSAAVVAAPPRIHFGRLPRRAPASAEILLKSPKGDPAWEVTDVKGTRKPPKGGYVKYTYTVTPVEDPRFHVFRVKVEHPGLDKEGPFRDGIVFTTTHPDRAEVLVQADIEIVARIRAQPRRMPLGFVRSGAPRPPSRVRLFAGAAGITFEITSVEIVRGAGRDEASAGFTATHGEDEQSWWVDVKYDGKARKKGLLEAELVIHTTDPEMPIVRVPITATIRG